MSQRDACQRVRERRQPRDDPSAPHLRTDHTPLPAAEALDATADLTADVATALADFNRRQASERIVTAIDAVNRHIESAAPWKLSQDRSKAVELANLLATDVASLERIARAINLVTPDLASRATAQLAADSTIPPTPIYDRLHTEPR
ncbi:MAG: hypothetical protein GY708_23585, partial [Actinomycetia bacterium]|nr:hypothetical protein [Actinomycetes bacterium]